MKLKMYVPVYLLLAVVATSMLLPMSGCNTAGCTDNHSALPQMGFYSSSSNQPVALDSLDLSGVGAPYDSLLVKSGTSVQQLYFPLRNNVDNTEFCFHYDYKEQGLDNPALNDTLKLWYTSEPYLASEECGAFYIYRITDISYTRHLIDSVAVVDSVINNFDMERFRIYFRVSEPEEPENPENPENPDTPENPENPDNPETPIEPGGTDEPGADAKAKNDGRQFRFLIANAERRLRL